MHGHASVCVSSAVFLPLHYSVKTSSMLIISSLAFWDGILIRPAGWLSLCLATGPNQNQVETLTLVPPVPLVPGRPGLFVFAGCRANTAGEERGCPGTPGDHGVSLRISIHCEAPAVRNKLLIGWFSQCPAYRSTYLSGPQIPLTAHPTSIGGNLSIKGCFVFYDNFMWMQCTPRLEAPTSFLTLSWPNTDGIRPVFSWQEKKDSSRHIKSLDLPVPPKKTPLIS